MTATKRRIALDIVATDTHCGSGNLTGRCPESSLGGACKRFRERLEYDKMAREYLRLPECIAAEGAGQKGGTC